MCGLSSQSRSASPARRGAVGRGVAHQGAQRDGSPQHAQVAQRVGLVASPHLGSTPRPAAHAPSRVLVRAARVRVAARGPAPAMVVVLMRPPGRGAVGAARTLCAAVPAHQGFGASGD